MKHLVTQIAYVGPGAGFAFLGSFLSLFLSVLAGLASFCLWPLRWLRRKRGYGKARVRKLICLGLDGLDPQLTERFMAEGKMPNLATLKESGTYKRLRTTCPPLSPVAWSTFATGVNPGKHNIFDFLNRNLRTYAPEISSAKVRKKSVDMLRKSEPFWKILGRYAIGSTILRVPITFPPDHFPGRLLSAMATPDLLGTQGTFSLYSTNAIEGENHHQLRSTASGYEGTLRGPVEIPFLVHGMTLDVQGASYVLEADEYTSWIRLRFGRAWGIARFLFKPIGDDFTLYVTPIQIDPENPALPISHPPFYAAYLSKLLGRFATLGMAEDTWAMNAGAIDGAAFLKQAATIQKEREAMFFSALDTTRRGVVACVFDTSDRVQHMFHRDAPVIEALYRDMDRLVGDTLRHVDSDTALFVLSDHGFCSFRRGINLNTWLRREGYLVENQGIDWTRTRAYTFGLSGVYLNLRGREAHGIVAPADAATLRQELLTKLSGLRDEKTQEIAILDVHAAAEIYSGPYLDAAPDLIIGYADGYRASWSAAVGKLSDQVFEDNNKAWCGDHCVDPSLVPGVLFSNRTLSRENPGIEDMAPTILHLFGVPAPSWMEGESLVGA